MAVDRASALSALNHVGQMAEADINNLEAGEVNVPSDAVWASNMNFALTLINALADDAFDGNHGGDGGGDDDDGADDEEEDDDDDEDDDATIVYGLQRRDGMGGGGSSGMGGGSGIMA